MKAQRKINELSMRLHVKEEIIFSSCGDFF
jgi:hypothetical protein